MTPYPTMSDARRSSRIATIIGDALTAMLDWHGRRGLRPELERLDDRLLRDIGLIRTDVLANARRPSANRRDAAQRKSDPALWSMPPAP